MLSSIKSAHNYLRATTSMFFKYQIYSQDFAHAPYSYSVDVMLKAPNSITYWAPQWNTRNHF